MTEVFQNLKNRLVEIEKGLGLDIEIDYKDMDSYQELTKAYLLLVHAEIEKYFEVLSVSILYYSFMDYEKNNIVKSPLLSASSVNLYSVVRPDDYDDPKHKEDMLLKKRIANVLQKYIQLANSNNGIRAKNVFDLLWTLGFSKDDVGEVLLMQLDAFGQKRGAIAHTDNNINKNVLNIAIEKKSIKDIINEIEKFDLIVESKKYLSEPIDMTKIESLIFRYAN